jgi:DNA-binding XRE family transcriptional regulator
LDTSPSENRELVEKLLKKVTMKKTSVLKIPCNNCDELRKQIALKIVIARKQANMNQGSLADLLQLSRQRLSIIENGNINQIDTLCLIANATGKPLGWFFERDAEPVVSQPSSGDLYKVVTELQNQVREMKTKYGKG